MVSSELPSAPLVTHTHTLTGEADDVGRRSYTGWLIRRGEVTQQEEEEEEEGERRHGALGSSSQ